MFRVYLFWLLIKNYNWVVNIFEIDYFDHLLEIKLQLSQEHWYHDLVKFVGIVIILLISYQAY